MMQAPAILLSSGRRVAAPLMTATGPARLGLVCLVSTGAASAATAAAGCAVLPVRSARCVSMCAAAVALSVLRRGWRRGLPLRAVIFSLISIVIVEEVEEGVTMADVLAARGTAWP